MIEITRYVRLVMYRDMGGRKSPPMSLNDPKLALNLNPLPASPPHRSKGHMARPIHTIFPFSFFPDRIRASESRAPEPPRQV